MSGHLPRRAASVIAEASTTRAVGKSWRLSPRTRDHLLCAVSVSDAVAASVTVSPPMSFADRLSDAAAASVTVLGNLAVSDTVSVAAAASVIASGNLAVSETTSEADAVSGDCPREFDSVGSRIRPLPAVFRSSRQQAWLRSETVSAADAASVTLWA